MIQRLFPCLVILLPFLGACQTIEKKTTLDSAVIFDPNTWVPPYNMIIPKDWGVERFSLPPDFAPSIRFSGVEDLRFAPGWADGTKEGYWSYAYVWWLDGKPALDAAGLQESLKAYYTGLVGRNIPRRKIPADKVVPTTVALKKLKSTTTESYGGEIYMLDYMAQQPMTLNAVIQVLPCGKHTAVLVQVSPKALTHAIWAELKGLVKEFNCN